MSGGNGRVIARFDGFKHNSRQLEFFLCKLMRKRYFRTQKLCGRREDGTVKILIFILDKI
jgi:hypothetical protein